MIAQQKSILINSAVIAVGLSLSGQATAQIAGIGIEVIRHFDTNKDGKISNLEAIPMNSLRSQMSAVERAKHGQALVAETPKDWVSIAEFNTEAWYKDLETACSPGEQRFYLRDRIINTSLLQPNLRKVKGDQATVSATRFNGTDSWAWSLDGAVTTVPIWSKCLGTEDWDIDRANLTGFALAPFVEFSGSGRSGNRGTSLLSLGANIEAQLTGGLFDFQQINIDPSYRTDFDLDAEIYHLGASWIPVRTDIHLGAYIGRPGTFEYWWTFSASTDLLSVRNPGRTNYAPNTEYGWIQADIGAHAYYRPNESSLSYFADINFQLAHEVISDLSANYFTADFGIFLDKDENTSLTLNYKKGTDVDTFVKKDQITLTLGVRF